MSDTQRVSHVALDSLPSRFEIGFSINYREIEPPRLTGEAYGTPVSLESRWVRMLEQLLRFPLSDLRSDVEGFPNIEGLRPGQRFRVLYTENRPRPGGSMAIKVSLTPSPSSEMARNRTGNLVSTCAGFSEASTVRIIRNMRRRNNGAL